MSRATCHASAEGSVELNAEEPPASFHDLLIQHLPSLRQQALALTRHRADAEDLLQTAVASALSAQDSFEPGTNFRAWMGSILRNRFLSNCRRRRETLNIEDAPNSLLGRSGGQEESLAMKELRRHLDRLQPDHRLVLLMISVQGLSYEEVSVQMGVPVGTLKARVSRARKQLRVWMLGEEERPAVATSARRPAVTLTAPGHTREAVRNDDVEHLRLS